MVSFIPVLSDAPGYTARSVLQIYWREPYDASRLMSTTVGYGTAAAATTAYTYDALGYRASETDPDGNVTSWIDAAAGRVLAETTSRGTTAYAYDAAGELASKADPTGRTIDYAYDGGRLVSQTWHAADGSVTDTLSYAYDAEGDLVATASASGSYAFTYDGGLLASQTDSNGLTLTYARDADGNVTSIADSHGATATFAYEGGLRTSQTYQDASTQSRIDYAYDPEGELLSATRYADLLGTQVVGRTQYVRDGGRVASNAHADGSASALLVKRATSVACPMPGLEAGTRTKAPAGAPGRM